MKQSVLFILLSFSYAGLVSPTDQAMLHYTHILFEWEQIPETNYYEIEIAEDSEFSNSIFNTTDNTLCFIEENIIEWSHSYFWRVRSISDAGIAGDWSSPFIFTTSEKISSSTSTIINELEVQTGVTIFGAFFNYFSAVIDQTGREIWNSGAEDFVYYNSNNTGNVFGCYLSPGAENNLPGKEISFSGETVWEEPNDDFLHHDLLRLPNGNYLGIIETSSLGPIPIGEWTSLFQGLGFQANGVTIEFPWVGDKLVEWDKDTKEIVWSWNIFDHFSMSDFDQFGGTWNEAYFSLHYDWTHVNAMTFDEAESALYISTRHLSRITKIDYPSGNIIWNLGHQMASGDVELGNDIGFSFQHSLQILENGNILTFDNGNLSSEFRNTAQPISRAIEILTDGSSASLAWSYELPSDLFGFASGNAQKLANGNVLITTVGGGGRSLEVNQNGNVVWEGLYNLSLPDGAVYRANRIPGIHPGAYSVMINNFMESDADQGVYLSSSNPEISFTIHNEGGFPLKFSAHITDSQGWFNNDTIGFEISPSGSEVISFEGNITASNDSNPVELTVIPIDHKEKSKVVSVIGYTTPLELDEELSIKTFTLFKPFPNPFNPKTMIHYSLVNDQKCLIQVYDIHGKLVQTLLNKTQPAGAHKIAWVANQQPSGLYFIKMTTESSTKNQKIMLLK